MAAKPLPVLDTSIHTAFQRKPPVASTLSPGTAWPVADQQLEERQERGRPFAICLAGDEAALGRAAATLLSMATLSSAILDSMSLATWLGRGRTYPFPLLHSRDKRRPVTRQNLGGQSTAQHSTAQSATIPRAIVRDSSTPDAFRSGHLARETTRRRRAELSPSLNQRRRQKTPSNDPLEPPQRSDSALSLFSGVCSPVPASVLLAIGLS